MPDKPQIKLALVDDHKLFRKGLISLITFARNNTSILFEADNGFDLQAKIDGRNLPDIILMDVNMPGMDGFQSVQWLREKYPSVKVLVISMIEKEDSIVQMLRLGVKGYLSKDVEPKELAEALDAVNNMGFYYTDFISGKLIHSLQTGGTNTDENHHLIQSLSERERDFLQLACSELTYAEIAGRMHLSPKTIDGYREAIFDKLKVKNRVGLVLYAVKHNLVTV